FEDIVTSKQEAAQNSTKFHFSLVAAGLKHFLNYFIVDIQCLQLMLCKKSFDHVVPKFPFSFDRLCSINNAKQSGFTLTIGTDSGNLVTSCHSRRCVSHNDVITSV